MVGRRVWSVLYREPAFRSLCESAGEGLYLEQTPRIGGRPRLVLGDRVTLSGDFAVAAGWIVDRPLVRIGDGAFLGHRLTINVARSVTIGDGALVAADCFISDYDGHPASYEDRIAGRPQPPQEVKPVVIGAHAWIGRGCMILKGVTIGEGAIVGAGSVVRSDVPPFAVAIGNPATVVRHRPRAAEE